MIRKLLDMLRTWRKPDVHVPVEDTTVRHRTPEEAKARRKAYRKRKAANRKRKAAKAARRRNRR